jgi:hypothetical protein
VKGDKKMKKVLWLFFCVLALSSGFTAAQDVLSYCDGQLVFQRPAGVTLWEERPRFNNVKEQTEFWHGKIRINVDIYDASALRTPPQMLMAKQVYALAQKGSFSACPAFTAPAVRRKERVPPRVVFGEYQTVPYQMLPARYIK